MEPGPRFPFPETPGSAIKLYRQTRYYIPKIPLILVVSGTTCPDSPRPPCLPRSQSSLTQCLADSQHQTVPSTHLEPVVSFQAKKGQFNTARPMVPPSWELQNHVCPLCHGSTRDSAAVSQVSPSPSVAQSSAGAATSNLVSSRPGQPGQKRHSSRFLYHGSIPRPSWLSFSFARDVMRH